MARDLAEPSNHHSATRGRRAPLRRLGGVPADDLLAHPLGPVSNRTRVLRPADRQQFVQQCSDLAERRQRRISGCNVGQLWCNRIMAEIQNAEALHLNRVLTGTDKQASDAHRHIAEQRAEGNGVVALARQPAPARRTAATPFAHRGHLRRNDLGLKRRNQPFRFG